MFTAFVALLVPLASPRQVAQPMQVVEGVPAQALLAQATRVAETLEFFGQPLPRADREALRLAAENPDDAAASKTVQRVLDKHCLVWVNINPEARVKVARGPARANLVEHGWRQFLVKVHNEGGITAELQAVSPNAMSVYEAGLQNASDRVFRPPMRISTNDRHAKPKPDNRARWTDLYLHNAQPMQKTLSGLLVEYRVLAVYSRDAGQREAKILFNAGQGTADLGFRSEADILFTAAKSSDVTFRVQDVDGSPTTARFIIRDATGRVYPSQTKRLAPDFFFHPQVYRADGEKVRLPAGKYTIEVGRGPEYLTQRREVTLTGKSATLQFQLARWVDPSKLGWWSGDHHIHAAGCAHYDNPSEGVHAPDMARHCQGEDLKVGCNLTWGPCFDYQKQFFTGKDDPNSKYPYLLRYDVEVSGFGSHQSGHLCLLRLKEQIPPGGDSWKHWPTLGLNTLKWAKKQGAVCGPAHSGNGIAVPPGPLPSPEVPRYDGIGANEYIVDVTHEVEGPDGKPVPAVDFISTVDTDPYAELTMWYHTLNCGYRTRISGETDFPCIFGERVGIGRSYVKLDGKLDFDRWCEGIRQGACYVSDGFSHLMDFKVNDLELGTKESEIKTSGPTDLQVEARVAALLPAQPDENAKRRYPWHIEKAREGNQVPVELIVNGRSVAREMVKADGKETTVRFGTRVDRSSWVALRIFPSSHTNPVFVIVDGKPIRASRKSAEWCLAGVEQCWQQKARTYRPEEFQDARAAYDHARQAYRRILEESGVE